MGSGKWEMGKRNVKLKVQDREAVRDRDGATAEPNRA